MTVAGRERWRTARGDGMRAGAPGRVTSGAGLVGVGVVACAACCAGPILATLGAVGVAAAVGYVAAGTAAIVAAGSVAAALIYRRWRRRRACEAPTSRVTFAGAPTPRPAPAARSRVVAALLLVVTAGLFALGASIEHAGHVEPHGAPSAHGEAEPAAGETSGGGEAHGEGEQAAGETSGGGEATILGVDPESPLAVASAVVASGLLAAAIYFGGRRQVAWAVVAFGSAFAVLDVFEVRHQIDETRAGLAVLAAVIALGHIGAASAAGVRARTGWAGD